MRLIAIVTVLFVSLFLPAYSQTDAVAASEWNDARTLMRYADSAATKVENKKFNYRKGKSRFRSYSPERTVSKIEKLRYCHGIVIRTQQFSIGSKTVLNVRLENNKAVMIIKLSEGFQVYSFNNLGDDKWLWISLIAGKNNKFQRKIVSGLKEQ